MEIIKLSNQRKIIVKKLLYIEKFKYPFKINLIK